MFFHILFDHDQGGFKVAQLTDEQGQDYTFLLDYDKAYLSMNDIREDIAARLEADLDDIELEEV